MPAANKMMPTIKTMSRRRVFGSSIFKTCLCLYLGPAIRVSCLGGDFPGETRAKMLSAHYSFENNLKQTHGLQTRDCDHIHRWQWLRLMPKSSDFYDARSRAMHSRTHFQAIHLSYDRRYKRSA